MKGFVYYVPFAIMLFTAATSPGLCADADSSVIDRFESDGQAVILIERLQKEFIVPIQELPAGSEESTWLCVQRHDEGLKVNSIDKKKTRIKGERVKVLLDRLKSSR